MWWYHRQSPESHTFLRATRFDIDIAKKRHISTSYDMRPKRGRHLPTCTDTGSRPSTILRICGIDKRCKCLCQMKGIFIIFFICLFIHSFIHPFTYSFIHSFAHSFAYSIILICSIMTFLSSLRLYISNLYISTYIYQIKSESFPYQKRSNEWQNILWTIPIH